MAKKKTSIMIDEDLYKNYQKLCIDQDMDISEGIENLVYREVTQAQKGRREKTKED